MGGVVGRERGAGDSDDNVPNVSVVVLDEAVESPGSHADLAGCGGDTEWDIPGHCSGRCRAIFRQAQVVGNSELFRASLGLCAHVLSLSSNFQTRAHDPHERRLSSGTVVWPMQLLQSVWQLRIQFLMSQAAKTLSGSLAIFASICHTARVVDSALERSSCSSHLRDEGCQDQRRGELEEHLFMKSLSQQK